MGFGEDKFVVEEKVYNHYDDGGENECAGSKNKFVGEGKMYGASDIEGEFVERSEEAE